MSTPMSSSRDPLSRKSRAEKVALFRYQLIRDAADAEVTSRQRGPMVRALAGEHHGPFGEVVHVSKDTIDRWIRLWRRGGFDALKPQGRTQGPVTDPGVLGLAETLKRENPARTAAQVRRIMISTLGDAPSESTLLRHFRTLDIPTGKPGPVTGRFEAAHPNEIWVGDGLHGPRVGGRKTYLFAFLDDHSRMVVAARWAYAEDTVRLAAALRPALESRGIPEAVYVDNGSAFSDASLIRICARLGIRLIHSRPYRPQGRGKIERFFRRVRDQFLVRNLDLSSLDVLNKQFTQWVEHDYNASEHSTLGMKPIDRFGIDLARIRFLTPSEDTDELFYAEAVRTVKGDNTFSFQGVRYETPVDLRGKKVELRYERHRKGQGAVVIYTKGQRMGPARLLDAVDNGLRRRKQKPD